MKRCHKCPNNGKFYFCWECAKQAEAALHPVPAWTPFVAMAVIHDDLKAEGFTECWKNSRYTVWVSRPKSDMGELIHLSIKRNDRNPLHDWRDLQRIKNEVLGPEEEALELYPKESRLVDTANQYHLWCFKGMTAPFGYLGRVVMEDVGETGAKQRPFDVKPPDLLTEEQYQAKLADLMAKQPQKETP